MKNSIIKFRHSIVAILMIVLNGIGAFASTPWTVNPSDYQYDMSLYLDISFADAKMDYSRYAVAVFSGDQCRGVAQTLSLDDGKECLYLRARSNQESGETMTFKYYDRETEEILSIDRASFQFESNSMLGLPSAPFAVKIVHYFNVDLSAGNLYKECTLDYGAAVTAEAAPVKEGFAFSLILCSLHATKR